jgi:hypothetical protein
MKPFAQLSSSSERHHRGVGLGLTIVQRNVAAIGGKLELRPTSGHGARFIVMVPAKTSTPKEKATRMPRRNFLHNRPAVLNARPLAATAAAGTF